MEKTSPEEEKEKKKDRITLLILLGVLSVFILFVLINQIDEGYITIFEPEEITTLKENIELREGWEVTNIRASLLRNDWYEIWVDMYNYDKDLDELEIFKYNIKTGGYIKSREYLFYYSQINYSSIE